MKNLLRYKPDCQIESLGSDFYDPVEAAQYPQHLLRYRNSYWASRVGLEDFSEKDWENHFATFNPLSENLKQPLAMRYHGHQFDYYNPQIGDGRGFIYAQIRDTLDGRLLDFGTKGSGRTLWSRDGDGRLTLKGGVREVLVTEMLEALGVYTSKTFSLFETGEDLWRPDEPSPTRSSVLVRLSHSHIRIGTFQYHAFYEKKDNIQKLIQFSVENYFPFLKSEKDIPLAFFKEVAYRNASMCASWMVAGFVHGVLNSDNMVVTGESFDYGPYRFLPTFNPNFVAAYFDGIGLYSYGHQPRAVKKNIYRLAVTLFEQPFPDEVEDIMDEFGSIYVSEMCRRFLQRLGVVSINPKQDGSLMQAANEFLEKSQVNYDSFFFDWYGGLCSYKRAMQGLRHDFYKGNEFDIFKGSLEKYTPEKPNLLEKPYYQREHPCCLLIDEIENIWQAIDRKDDWLPFNDKIASIKEMKQVLSLGISFEEQVSNLVHR